MRSTRARCLSGIAAALAAALVSTNPSAAAELNVFTSGAPSAAQKALAPEFSAASGHHVVLTIGTLNEIRQKLSGGGRPDVVVLPVPALNALDKSGKLQAGSRIELARVGVGVVVREGAPLPDISTVDAFRSTMLAAHSVAHTDPQGGGFAGAQVVRVFERLGIAEAVKAKASVQYAISGGVASVAKGEAEIGLFNISEILPVKGVTLVGPLPAELQSYIVFAGEIDASSPAPEAAAAYLRFLAAPQSHDAWVKAGFEWPGKP